MATYTKFNQAIADAFNKKHDFGNDSFKFMLTNVAPIATNSIKSDLTEIAAGNGYTTGGVAVLITSATQTGGVLSVVPTASVLITASGGSIGPFRYAVFYNDTSTSPLKPLVSFYDRGASVTLADGEALSFNVGSTLFTAS